MCPLCRVAHRFDREYVWYFLDEYSSQDWALERVRRARGFCGEHAEQLRAVEVDGLRSTLGISSTYLDTIEGLDDDLAAMQPADTFVRATLPGVRQPPRGHRQERRLPDRAARAGPALPRALRRLTGLCVPHFALLWGHPSGERERALVLAVQRRAAQALRRDLSEHIRKQGAEFKDEPKGREEDSWRRAIWLTAGRPAPQGTAATPEDEGAPGRASDAAH